MNRKLWGIIIVIIGMALMAGLVYFIFFYKPEVEPVSLEQNIIEAANTVSSEVEDTAPEPTSAPNVSLYRKFEVSHDDLARMASAFSERFGSFSNQSDYGNIRDLQIFMTPKMKDWSQNYINEARGRKTDASIYYGIVTKAVSSDAALYDPDLGQAEILVKTQRRESSGVSANSSTFYQDLLIKYTRDKGVWRVDGAYWQDR